MHKLVSWNVGDHQPTHQLLTRFIKFTFSFYSVIEVFVFSNCLTFNKIEIKVLRFRLGQTDLPGC